MGNREKLLETACTIFGKQGYSATSVDDILEAAQVAPSNFYYHFRSKEELGAQVLESIFGSARAAFAPIFTQNTLGASEKLERLNLLFVNKMADSGCCGGCPMGNLAQELSDSHPGFRKRLAAFFEECMKGIEDVVREGIRSGEFRDDLDPHATAFLLFGSIEGLMLLSKSLKDVAPLKQGFRQGLTLLRKH